MDITDFDKLWDLKLSSIGALAGKNAGTLTSMLNSEDGRKIAVITAETAGTVTACYCTTRGINYTICDIPIKTIKL